MYYLEKFNESLTLDSAKTGAAASSVTMAHLNGKTVEIVRDGVLEASQTVPASPHTVTFATAATSSHQVGLDYSVTLKTMPAEPKLPQGTVQGVNKRIVQVDAIVHKTQNMSINGKLVPFRKFGTSVLGSRSRSLPAQRPSTGCWASATPADHNNTERTVEDDGAGH